VELNAGKFLHEFNDQPNENPFCIGVAGYPEKHFESPNIDIDLRYLKAKVDSGADYIVTQLFFDNAKFFDFVHRCRNIGITVPIIPGIKPLTQKRQVSVIPKIFNIDLPTELADAMIHAKNDQEAKEAGIQWSIRQSRELKDAGVPCIHYYTMGKSEAVKQIAKAVF
jgi:methylenetetrahydrofolate reductase (NADPH)